MQHPQDGYGLSIWKELEIISPVYIIGNLPVLTPTEYDTLDRGCFGNSHAPWDYPICWFKCLRSRCSCTGFLHASVVVLLECHVPTHPEAQPACCFFVALNRAISDCDLCCQHWPEKLHIASSTCEQCLLCFCYNKLQPPRTCLLTDCCSTFLMFRDDLFDVASCHHTSEVIHECE